MLDGGGAEEGDEFPGLCQQPDLLWSMAGCSMEFQIIGLWEF